MHDTLGRLVGAILAAAVLAGGGAAAAAAAAAAPVFVSVGSLAPGDGSGGCLPCTTVQRTTSPAGAYAFPFSGVLTRFSTRTGSTISTIGGEWMRARTFRLGDATHALVVSESAQANITTPSTVQTYWDRVAATAGDVLGAQFRTGANVSETPYVFTATTSAGDTASRTTGAPPEPNVGDQAVGTAFGNQRVNISARLERDDDHDGYGDGSQDLCLGDATHTTTACSGTLFGSNLQAPYKQVGFSCGYACGRVQLTSGGVSTSPTADGVVVRWRMQAPVAGDYHVAIVDPAAGGGYTLARVSTTVAVAADEALWTIPTRLPIKAGGFVAFVPPPFAIQASFQITPPGATYANINDAPVGSPAAFSSSLAGALLYDADIEPDIDHDGYGDITQDACPSSAATQAACLAPMSPPPPPAAAPAAPPPAPAPAAPLAPKSPSAALFSAKLQVLRAAVRDRELDVLARITGRATGRVRVSYRSSGKTNRLTVPIRTGTIRVRLRSPSSTGILTMAYGGNDVVRGDDVRLRAAAGKALLRRTTTRIDSGGRLRVSGTISKRARGVVRVRLGYTPADGSLRLLNYTAKIRNGTWSLTETMPAVAALAGGQLSIQYTGYGPRRIRGEQLAKAVSP